MLNIKTKQGYTIFVPEYVDNSSTYVLLEKEEWFERELPFLVRWLRPGMRVIDVGANLGVYTLAAARAVGAGGHVYSIEPGAHPRKYLEASCETSGLGNVSIIPQAISDFDGHGYLKGDDSELASLAEHVDEGVEVETVAVARLDTLADRMGWDGVEFLKIDVEGGEHKVVTGGWEFLRRNSPLIMFEFRSDAGTDSRARRELEALGYRIYRILGNGEYLVPAPECKELPVHDLNLFAVKGDRIRELEAKGLLVDSETEIDAADMTDFLDLDSWIASPFATSLEMSREDFSGCLQDRVLLNFLVSINRKAPARVRYGALLYAWSTSRSLISAHPSLNQWLTHSRLAWELGDVMETLAANRYVNERIRSEAVAGLFVPPLPRFDNIAIEPGYELDWFSCVLGEQAIRSVAHSTAFEPQLEKTLLVLCTNRYATPEMARALILRRLWNGNTDDITDGLWQLASDGLNPQIWNPSSWGGI
ncbi:FkbM family methyltransferase [Azospira restricta]|uniref:FkbM family methyltransferase n=1 Tax=Azospira restricta TaxID=404405 RepID=A0A974SNJ6_9RHOO|nr:FkbM family methyltransferase [Azospira restricta]QRJ63609.1 FkbM family methyltransferase [Azospira restricta]